MQNNLVNLDIKIDSDSVFSSEIQDILIAGSNLIITTSEGDVLRLELNLRNQSISLFRYNQITQIKGQLQAMS